MVLTCNTCNHGSGSFVQGEMKKRDNFHDAFIGPLDKPHPVIMTLSTGAVVRAEMVRGADGYQLNILGGNSPEAVKQFRDDMNHLTETKNVDWSVNLDFYQYAYDRVSAHVGWLREAYLVAFAVFGYRYMLDPALEPVRQQLARPREQLISTFKVEDRKHGADLRLFSVINEPDWLRSVAIQFGHRTVFLPQLGDPDLYPRLDHRRQAIGSNREQVELGGQVWDAWPNRPLHLMDFRLSRPLFVAEAAAQTPSTSAP